MTADLKLHDPSEDSDDPLDALLGEDPGLEARLDAGDADAWAEVAAALRTAAPGQYADCPPPRRPTRRPAGSASKRKLMAERVADGFQPTHPQDAPPDPEGVGTQVKRRGNGTDRRKGLEVRPAA